MQLQQFINELTESVHVITKEVSNLYTQQDEIKLLREGLAKLSSSVYSLKGSILAAQSKRTYYTVKEVLEVAYDKVSSVSNIVSYYNQPNLYNVKNKEDMIRQYNNERKERDIEEQERYLDFIKQLEENYPT